MSADQNTIDDRPIGDEQAVGRRSLDPRRVITTIQGITRHAVSGRSILGVRSTALSAQLLLTMLVARERIGRENADLLTVRGAGVEGEFPAPGRTTSTRGLNGRRATCPSIATQFFGCDDDAWRKVREK